MLNVRYGRRFRRELQDALKAPGRTPQAIKTVVDLLAAEKPLPPKYRDHKLSGDYAGYRECHILPDWLLIYRVEHDTLTLVLTRTGSHSDLF
ncbi:MAG: type II toxin-antitoxin system YafQ family toxin [Selenomonadaceae bacterium]|nr:type II toxin-antitoxin system YafQ family toxin [Selenomonadaceae bacterium]